MIIDFRMTPPQNEWLTLEEAQRIMPDSYLRGYLGTYSGAGEMFRVTTDDLIRSMNQAGVDAAVLQAEWAIGDYRKQNDAVHRLVRAHPVQSGHKRLNCSVCATEKRGLIKPNQSPFLDSRFDGSRPEVEKVYFRVEKSPSKVN